MHRVITLVVLLSVAALTVGPGSAVAAANPNEPCRGTDETTVRIYLDSEERVKGSEPLYPGTTLTMYVCSGGDPEPFGSAWGFNPSEVSGITSIQEEAKRVVFTLSGETETTSPAQGITKKGNLDGPTIGIQRGYMVTTAVTDVTLQFPSADTRRTYVRAEDDWLQATTSLKNASGTLQTLSTQQDQILSSSPEAALDRIRAANLTSANAALQRASLYASVTGDARDVRRVADASDERTTTIRAESRSALQDYIDAVDAQRSAAAFKVRLVVGGALVGGILVGSILGYLLARRTLGKIELDRGVSTASQYSLRQIALPVALGILALGVAIVGAVLGRAALFEVIL